MDHSTKTKDTLHLLSDTDETGKKAYYFIKVPPEKRESFLEMTKSGKPANLLHYGEIVFSAYGTPSQQILHWMHDQYGWQS